MIDTKIATCLWYDGQAEEAATFYAATFPDSRVTPSSARPAIIPPATRATC